MVAVVAKTAPAMKDEGTILKMSESELTLNKNVQYNYIYSLTVVFQW